MFELKQIFVGCNSTRSPHFTLLSFPHFSFSERKFTSIINLRHKANYSHGKKDKQSARFLVIFGHSYYLSILKSIFHCCLDHISLFLEHKSMFLMPYYVIFKSINFRGLLIIIIDFFKLNSVRTKLVISLHHRMRAYWTLAISVSMQITHWMPDVVAS